MLAVGCLKCTEAWDGVLIRQAQSQQPSWDCPLVPRALLDLQAQGSGPSETPPPPGPCIHTGMSSHACGIRAPTPVRLKHKLRRPRIHSARQGLFKQSSRVVYELQEHVQRASAQSVTVALLSQRCWGSSASTEGAQLSWIAPVPTDSSVLWSQPADPRRTSSLPGL